ncbi:MAG: hypothetical protein JST91_19650 [Actinobacteria bacterium]|nr:hypothetical protein [Actinomycetota bacterium]
MTRQTGMGWRRGVVGALACGAMAAGLLAGAGTPIALAQPDDATTAQADTPREMTADEALAIVAKDYDLGAGGGQLSKLIHEVLTLRQQGYRPSSANRQAITKALDYRPNQGPLIKALQETVAYQRKIQAQMAAAGATGGPFTVGINQTPPGMPAPDNGNSTGVFVSPGGGQQPIGP